MRAGVSQRMVFGRDRSEFAKQGAAGTVSDPMLRTQESSWSVTMRSVWLWSSLGPCGSKHTSVYRRELN